MPVALDDRRDLGPRTGRVLGKNNNLGPPVISSQHDPHQRIATTSVNAHGLLFMGENTLTMTLAATKANNQVKVMLDPNPRLHQNTSVCKTVHTPTELTPKMA